MRWCCCQSLLLLVTCRCRRRAAVDASTVVLPNALLEATDSLIPRNLAANETDFENATTTGFGFNNGQQQRRLSASVIILCRLTWIDTMLEGGYSMRQVGCVVMDHGGEAQQQQQETDLLLMIRPARLIPLFIREHAGLESGTLRVAVRDATIRQSDESLHISDQSEFEVMSYSRPDDEEDTLQRQRRRQLSPVGATVRKSVMVVRVVSADGVGPVSDLDQMRERLFGNGTGMATQFSACSAGQLEFYDAGGLQVTLPQNMSHYTTSSKILSAAQVALQQQHLTDANGKLLHVSTLADHIMFCQPPGTGRWLAIAAVNHWRSQYNNEFCTSLSATCHEIGHNLGLLHSGEKKEKYRDTTGYMGYGGLSPEWPRKCFNGYKHHQLKWFRSRELFLKLTSDDIAQIVDLAAFVDFDKTTPSQYVLINIWNRYFLHFNRAKLFNVDTQEKRDQVTITENSPGFSLSLAGLGVGDTWNVTIGAEVSNQDDTPASRILFVRVCQKLPAKENSGVDAVLLGIAIDTTHRASTVCELLEPTPAPSVMPAFAPTLAPPFMPTRSPCLRQNMRCDRHGACCVGTVCIKTGMRKFRRCKRCARGRLGYKGPQCRNVRKQNIQKAMKRAKKQNVE